MALLWNRGTVLKLKTGSVCMKKSDSDAKFTVDGVWWLPQKPSAKLPGTLLVEDGEDIHLKLFGVLGDPRSGFSIDFSSFPIILGTSDRNEPCTLSDTYEMKRPAEPDRQAVATTELRAERAYIGKHFPTPSDVQFTSVEVRYTDLEWWLGWTPFEKHRSAGGIEWKVDQANLCRRIVEFTDSDRSATLTIWSRVSEIFSFTEPGAEHKVYVQIAPSVPSTFQWFMEYPFDIRNLFTLLMGSPVYIEIMRGFGDEVEFAPGAKCPEDIRIHFRKMPFPKRDHVYPSDMPATYASIRDRTDEVFRTWLSNAQRLRLVSELFFGAQYNPQMYAESKFLNFTQALEVFDRATQQKHGNRHTLRYALHALIDALDSQSKRKISDNPTAFVDKVVKMRNYLTHGDERLKRKVLSDSSRERLEEYIYVYRRLRAILTLHLLRFIGISEAQVATRVFRGM